MRFDSAEDWRTRQQFQGKKLGPSTNKRPSKHPSNRLEIVGAADPLTNAKLNEIDDHYTSLKELDSSEEGKLNSPEGALCKPDERLKYVCSMSIDASMALLHRALKAGAPIDVRSWCPPLLLMIEFVEDTRQRNQAHRLYQELASIMTEAELGTSRDLFEAHLRLYRPAKVVSIKEGPQMKRF